MAVTWWRGLIWASGDECCAHIDAADYDDARIAHAVSNPRLYRLIRPALPPAAAVLMLVDRSVTSMSSG